MRTALRRLGRLFYLLLFIAATLKLHAAPATTTVTGIIYRADNTPAAGTLLISWPAFNTADNQAVAAGTMSLAIGPTGAISLALVPTEGATPAGVSYKVIYKLDEAISQREIVDEAKFQDGLGKVIDGVVQCLNASAWAKAK